MHPKIEMLFNATREKHSEKTKDIESLINALNALGASMTEAWIVLYKCYKIDELIAEEELLNSNFWGDEDHAFRMYQVALYLENDFGNGSD